MELTPIQLTDLMQLCFPWAALIAGLASVASTAWAARNNKKSREAAGESTDMMEEQQKFYDEILKNRENQRNYAVGQWGDLLNKQQKYETPKSVGSYVNLMMDSANALAQLRDPSNKDNIDYRKYKTGGKEYDQLKGSLEGLEDMTNEINVEPVDKSRRNDNDWYQKIMGQDTRLRDTPYHQRARGEDKYPVSSPGHYYIASPGDSERERRKNPFLNPNIK